MPRLSLCTASLLAAAIAAATAFAQEGAANRALERRRFIPPPSTAPATATAPATTPSTGPAAKAALPATAEPFPGGLVDAQWKTAYVTGTAGELEAIDLATGKKLWASANAARPLAIDGDRVYALTATSSSGSDHPAHYVIALSIKSEGKRIFESKPITLSPILIGDGGLRQIIAAGKIDGGTLLVSWSASAEIHIVNNGWQQAVQVQAARIDGNISSASNFKIDLKDGTAKIVDGNPLVPLASAEQLKHAGRTYKLAVDKEKGTAQITCTDEKTAKIAWQYDVQGQPPAPLPGSPAPPMGIDSLSEREGINWKF